MINRNVKFTRSGEVRTKADEQLIARWAPAKPSGFMVSTAVEGLYPETPVHAHAPVRQAAFEAWANMMDHILAKEADADEIDPAD